MLKALDLYSCSGGASRGLMDAGFHVTGVDTIPQKPIHDIGARLEECGRRLRKRSPAPRPRQRTLSALRRPDRDLPRQGRQTPDALLLALRNSGDRAGE